MVRSGLSEASRIDGLLAAEKTLAGRADWQEGLRPGEWRAAYTLLRGGETCGASLGLKAYPGQIVDGYEHCRFKIMLLAPDRVWGIDFEPMTFVHHIPLDRVHLLEGIYVVRGPHYHAWSDNRHLATPGALPSKLKCVRMLPPKIRRWEQAFRWFCGETNISLGAGAVLPLPERRELW